VIVNKKSDQESALDALFDCDTMAEKIDRVGRYLDIMGAFKQQELVPVITSLRRTIDVLL
jgi:hypothetical protein